MPTILVTQGGGQGILSLRPAWAKLSKLYLENKIEKQKGAGGMAQEPLVSILIIAKKKKNFWN
jgi:hypothetical protein